MTDRLNHRAVTSMAPQTTSSETCGTSFSRPDALESLFEKLRTGYTPDFLEMMAALSDVSVLMTPDGDCPDCQK